VATHDYVIANGTGAAVRSDLNGALAAIVSNNSSATQPATMYAYQWWADTTTGLLKIRNSANSAWVTLFQLDGEWSTLPIENGTAAAPSIYFKDSGTDTGFYSPGADQVGISTGGTSRIVVDASGNVNIDSNTFYVDAANNRVGIGTSSPSAPLHITASTDGPQSLLFLVNTSEGGTNETAALQLGVRGTFGGSACKVIAGKEGDHSSTASIDNFLQFTTTENDVEAVRMHITAAGRVGIGTTTPLATLESGGGVNKASIRIADGAHDGSSSTFRYPALTYYARQDNTRRAIDPLTQGTGSNGGASAAIVFTDEPGNYSFPNNVRSSSIEFYTADNNVGGSVGHEPLNRLSISSTGTSTFTSNASTAPAIFKIDASEVSRIDSSGRLLVGTSTRLLSDARNRLNVDSGSGTFVTGSFKNDAGSAAQVIETWNASTSGDAKFISFLTEAAVTERGLIDYNRAAGLVRYNVTSDRRLKSAIQPATSAVDLLSSIQVRSYIWTETGYTVNYGFVAQELNQVLPDAVKVGDDGEEVQDTWAVDNSKLVPLLTKALQEAIAKIEALEADVAALKGA